MARTYTYLASKPRYEILDGLRGVAAILVLIYHLLEPHAISPAKQTFLNHGYLAVDFFFLLSGFVIGYAYDNRWDKMSLKDFFKRRLIRLHPMVIFGTLVGALFYYLGDSAAFPLIGQTEWWMVLLLFLWGCTMLPAPSSWDIRGWGETNALNGPSWSLLWEYIANLLYALFIRHFSKLLLGIFTILSALLTINLCLNIDIFDVLDTRSYAAYTVIGGWSLKPDQLLIGITRLLYPFFAGLFLSRISFRITLRGGFWWCSLGILVLLFMPRIGGESHMWMNGMYEAICILLFFPVIITIGAGSKITDKRSTAVCNFLGNLSYPLYITHYSLIYLYWAWISEHKDAPASMHVFLAVTIFFLAIGIGYASMKLYDIPVRQWLTKKFLMKNKP